MSMHFVHVQPGVVHPESLLCCLDSATQTAREPCLASCCIHCQDNRLLSCQDDEPPAVLHCEE